MNKLLYSILAIAYVANTLCASAVAREEPYEGKCLYLNEQEEKQEFKSCQVNLQQSNLIISFEKEEHQDDNKTISSNSIFEIASGEYAQQLLSDSGSIVSGVLFAPINLVAQIFSPKRDYQQYIIQYKNTDEVDTATILNIDRSDAPEFQQELSLATGKLITFQEGQTNTTIDVGPNRDDIKSGN